MIHDTGIHVDLTDLLLLRFLELELRDSRPVSVEVSARQPYCYWVATYAGGRTSGLKLRTCTAATYVCLML